MNYSELHYILCYRQTPESYQGSAGTLHFPAHTHQASAETGTGNGGETLQPKWKYLCTDLYRKKIHGIRP